MRRVLLGALPLLAALLLAACGGGDSDDPTAAPTSRAANGATTATAATPTEQPDAGPNEALSIDAADGDATLQIPPGALPPGVTPEDVSITLLEGPSEERFAVYRLEPDGMVPLEPLILTVPIDLAEGEGVSVTVVDGDGNAVDGAAEIVGLAGDPGERGPRDLLLRVNHFSAWIIGKVDGSLRIDIEPLDDQLVGTTFTVRARVAKDPELRVERDISRLQGGSRRYVGTNEDVRSWSLFGSWKAAGPLSPSEAKNPGTPVDETRQFYRLAQYDSSRSAVVVEQQFKCERAGDFAISFAVRGGLSMILRRAGSTASFLTLEEPAPVSWSATCVGPATATPEPTATSTQTPLETPVPTQTETPPTQTPTETATPNRPPVVSAISATVALPVTTYVIEVSDLDGDALTIMWSGTNCGSATGSTTSTMKWSHGSGDCPHNTVEHADATINVVVSDGRWRVTCSYGGAASGTGKACEAPVPSS